MWLKRVIPVAVPVQSAAVIGPSAAGMIVEWVGSQRVLFLVAAVVLLVAWVLLQRVRVKKERPANLA